MRGIKNHYCSLIGQSQSIVTFDRQCSSIRSARLYLYFLSLFIRLFFSVRLFLFLMFDIYREKKNKIQMRRISIFVPHYCPLIGQSQSILTFDMKSSSITSDLMYFCYLYFIHFKLMLGNHKQKDNKKYSFNPQEKFILLFSEGLLFAVGSPGCKQYIQLPNGLRKRAASSHFYRNGLKRRIYIFPDWSPCDLQRVYQTVLHSSQA